MTAIPWPIGTVPIVEPDQRSRGSTAPADSPGKSIPVGLPKPKRAIQRASRSGPSRSLAIVTVPTFDDSARIRATVSRSVGRGSCSWMTRSATWIDGGSVKAVRGETSPSESAAEIVTSLKVEPGSYMSVIARLRRRSAETLPKRFASKPGATAIASTAPVRGSRTIADAAFACQRCTVSASTASAFAWIWWSIVRRTSLAGALGAGRDDVDRRGRTDP